MEKRIISNREQKATCAALYAVGSVIPAEGIPLLTLQATLCAHLENTVFQGLISRLRHLRILDVESSTVRVIRGSEWKDGLEKLRLLGEALKTDPSLQAFQPEEVEPLAPN